MEKIQRICSLVLLAAFWGCVPVLHAQSFDKLWKQVEQAQEKSLPQTVIKLTDEIFRKGEREKNTPQMLKAYMCRNTYIVLFCSENRCSLKDPVKDTYHHLLVKLRALL